MAKESSPGSTYFIAGRACVSCGGGGSTGYCGCVSPESQLLSSGSPLLLQRTCSGSADPKSHGQQQRPPGPLA